MLRLGKLTDYATVILSYMAKNRDTMYAAGEIAEFTGITQATVSKILKLLMKAKILTSVRGAKGGYLLAKPPELITIAAIINALEGPIALTECSISQHSCEQAQGCDIKSNWLLINQTIYRALESVTLADMILPTAPLNNEVYVPVTSLYR